MIKENYTQCQWVKRQRKSKFKVIRDQNVRQEDVWYFSYMMKTILHISITIHTFLCKLLLLNRNWNLHYFVLLKVESTQNHSSIYFLKFIFTLIAFSTLNSSYLLATLHADLLNLLCTVWTQNYFLVWCYSLAPASYQCYFHGILSFL